MIENLKIILILLVLLIGFLQFQIIQLRKELSILREVLSVESMLISKIMNMVNRLIENEDK